MAGAAPTAWEALEPPAARAARPWQPLVEHEDVLQVFSRVMDAQVGRCWSPWLHTLHLPG